MAGEDEELLEELLLQWQEAHEAGRELPAAALCVGRPDLVPALDRQARALLAMSFLDKPIPGHEGATAQAGQVLHRRYRLDAAIGQGRQGEVWRAFDTLLQRPVAVKLPRGGDIDRTASLEAARRVASLDDHDNFIKVLDVFPHGGGIAVVSVLIDGRNMSAHVQNLLPPGEVIRLIAQVAGALGHAHQRGTLHRDIKTSNILVAGRKAYLGDFGAAARVGEVPAEENVPGTLAYTAPEVLQGEPHDVRSELFSLGVVFYELLAGQHPFLAATRAETRDRLLHHRPVPPHRLRAAVPQKLSAVCMKCLSKAPGDRFQTAPELQDALESVAAELTTRARACKPRLLHLAVGLAVALALVAVGMAFWPKRAAPTQHPAPGGNADWPKRTAPAHVLGHYRLTEGNGSKVFDSDGSAVGSHNATCGRLGLEFRGGEFATIRGKFVFHEPGDATVECWLKPLAEADAPVIWSSTGRHDTNRFHLYLGSGWLGFDYRGPDGELHTLLPPGEVKVVTGAWTHVAITRTRHTYRAYKDGAAVYTATDGSPYLPTATGWTLAGRGGHGPRFVGIIAEVRVSGAALSSGEFLRARPR